MEPDEARAGIDDWFRDRSVDDVTAIQAFRTITLSPRTTADELAATRLRLVDYLMATRNLDRASAVKVASLRIDSWFAGSTRSARHDAIDEMGPYVLVVGLFAIGYGLFSAAIGWLALRLSHGEGYAAPLWFWVTMLVGSPVIAYAIAFKGPDRFVPLVFVTVPALVAAVLLLLGA
jgi:hypothetical protein